MKVIVDFASESPWLTFFLCLIIVVTVTKCVRHILKLRPAITRNRLESINSAMTGFKTKRTEIANLLNSKGINADSALATGYQYLKKENEE